MTLPHTAILLIAALALAACEPDVGSPEWCDSMEEKEQGKWTLDETGDFTKYCVLGMKPE